MFKEGIARFLKLDHLMENITGYVETRIELLKYDLKEEFSKAAAKILVYLGLGAIAMFFMFFTTFAVAYMLADYLGTFEGFAIVSGCYLILGVILFMKRKYFITRVEKEIGEVFKEKKK